MTADARELFDLLPAVHRIRDARIAEEAGLPRGPLEDLIAVMAEQIAVAAESLDQAHDDLFIETCADWVVPYIGDLIGYESLHSVVPAVASPRAEVAHTIALRRRKGTALVLEQLARDVTGWDAKAVEYFQRLAWTQYMNHVRPQAVASPDMRQSLALEWIPRPRTARWTSAGSRPAPAATTSRTSASTSGASAPTRTATPPPSGSRLAATA